MSAPIGNDDGLVMIQLPSGAVFPVHEEEVDYFNERVTLYLKQNHFPNISDLQDLDRMMILELMVYRWGTWLSRQKDWWDGPVDPNELQKSLHGYCVDEETEALTRRGWQRYSEIAVGDEILTLDASAGGWDSFHGVAEWQAVTAVNVFPGPHRARHLRTNQHDSVTTFNHRWWTRRIGLRPLIQKHFLWSDTATLDRYDRIPIVAPCMDLPAYPKYTDAFVELVGWYWTEGSCQRPAMTNGEICQSNCVNPLNVGRIRAALTIEFGAPGRMKPGAYPQPRARWNEKIWPNRPDMTYFKMAREVTELLEWAAPEHVLNPEFLGILTLAQLRLLIETSVAADGSQPSYQSVAGSRTSRYITQRREQGIRSFEMACILAGFGVHTYHQDIGQWRMSILKSTEVAPAISGLDVEVEIPLVWCPTVPNGIWLARRNGTVYYTGNSTELRQLKKLLGIDKVTRDKQKGEDSVSSYLTNLGIRAKEFVYMRQRQFDKTLELMMQMKALLTLNANTDAVEQREMHVTDADVLEWLRTIAVPEFDEIDLFFRTHQQRLWIRNQ